MGKALRTIEYKDLTPGQRQMVDDGLPIQCIATPETVAREREYWAKNPPVSIPFAQVNVTRNESPETKAFRAQEDERKRLKSLAGIARMKTRFASRAIDYSKMRWDARHNKFVEIALMPNNDRDRGVYFRPPHPSEKVSFAPETKSKKRHPNLPSTHPANRGKVIDPQWSRLTKDNAEAVAKLNGVWKDDYEKLRGTGRIVMTVGNLLRGIAKRGGMVKWN